jgi:nucleoside-diphosphate-sugar epimerase
MDIDDAARLLAWLCQNYVPGRLEVLNAQGRGAPVTGEQLARLVGLSILRLPSYRLVGFLYRVFWALGISPVPAEAYPYFVGSYVMNTSKLEQLLGKEYEAIVRCTTEEAVRKIAISDSH